MGRYKTTWRDGMTRTGMTDSPLTESQLIPLDELEAVFGAITRERQYQDAKWGTIDENPHRISEWIVIMKRGIDETVKGMVDFPGHEEALKEILQVVAVGVACLQQHGIVER